MRAWGSLRVTFEPCAAVSWLCCLSELLLSFSPLLPSCVIWKQIPDIISFHP